MIGMKNESYKITTSRSNNVYIEATPGHFVTSHSHINYYIDITQIKHEQSMAREAAKIMAEDFNIEGMEIDTIICMDGIEVLGAFVAYELAKPNLLSVNPMEKIYVIPPEFNSNGQMIFRDNLQRMVSGKKCLLLIASVTTGKTIKRSLECIEYYGGEIVGISAVFSAVDTVQGIPVHSLFNASDVPDYHTFSYRDCPECKGNIKVDALVNSYGYSEI